MYYALYYEKIDNIIEYIMHLLLNLIYSIAIIISELYSL